MYKLLATIMIFASSFIYAEITYPEYYYVIDKETNFRIVLGGVPRFVSEFYDGSLSKELLFEATDPKYKIWKETFANGLIINYSTYDFTITSIDISDDKFITSKGIGVGSTRDEVTQIYGEPISFFKQFPNMDESFFSYEKEHKEINGDGEYSVIVFTFENDIVVEFYIAIYNTA